MPVQSPGWGTKSLHATEQLTPPATTTEPAHSGACVLQRKDILHAATKTQCRKMNYIKKKKRSHHVSPVCSLYSPTFTNSSWVSAFGAHLSPPHPCLPSDQSPVFQSASDDPVPGHTNRLRMVLSGSPPLPWVPAYLIWSADSLWRTVTDCPVWMSHFLRSYELAFKFSYRSGCHEALY